MPATRPKDTLENYLETIILIARHFFIERKANKEAELDIEPFPLNRIAKWRIGDRQTLNSILEKTHFRYHYLDPTTEKEKYLDSPEAIRNWVTFLDVELKNPEAVLQRMMSILESQREAELKRQELGKKEETTQSPKPSLLITLSTWGSIASILGLIVGSVALWFSLPNYVKDFVKEAFLSKDVLYLIGISVFQTIGFLASVTTLIMFIDWFRKKR